MAKLFEKALKNMLTAIKKQRTMDMNFWRNKMGKYNTKYFGEISIDEASDFESIDIQYKNKEINISLSDCNMYGNKLKTCLNIIDKYIEINQPRCRATRYGWF